MSTGVTPDSPRPQAATATSASPCRSVKGSDPRPVSTTVPSAAGCSSSSSSPDQSDQSGVSSEAPELVSGLPGLLSGLSWEVMVPPA